MRSANLADLLRDSIDRYGRRPLFGVRSFAGWTWISYEEFGEMVAAFRGGLAAIGVERADRVAVISKNRLEWAVAAHACYGLPATYVPMYESQSEDEWAYVLGDSGAKVCIVDNDSIAARIETLRARLPLLTRVLNFSAPPDDENGYSHLLRIGASAPHHGVSPDATEIASLVYTSGTTGTPKGVMLSHAALASSIAGVLAVADTDPDDRSVSFLPWAHVFGGCTELHLAIASGGSLAICDDASKLLTYLPEVRPTILFAVPRVWNRVYDGVKQEIATKPAPVRWLFERAMRARRKLRRGDDVGPAERMLLTLSDPVVFAPIRQRFGGRLRMAVSGAAALSQEVAEFVDGLGIQVFEGYGMTEGCGITTASRPDAVRPGSVGKVIPGVSIELDTSAPGCQGGEGEIILHGACLFSGYHNLPDATAEVMTPDGGIRTGDLARIDSDGFVYITGRSKELYKLENGKYVAPAPLEEALQLSPYIAQCVIFGADRPYNVALIVPDRGALWKWAAEQGLANRPDVLSDPRTIRLFKAELEKHGRAFKGFERPRAFILEGDELSTDNGMLTPTLKVRRRSVLARFQTRLDALYM
jgi:long-chain acyl-CoA synthetase